MSERLDLFPTPVMKAIWPMAGELGPALLQAINQKRHEDGGVARSNIGGWQSNGDMAIWGGQAAITLASFATEIAGQHTTDIHPAGKRTFNWSVEMWANINPTGAAHQVHCHPGSLWTAIYFADTGGTETEDIGGELILEDPRYPMAYTTVPDLLTKLADGTPNNPQIAIKPEANLLVVFPSWLRHSIAQNRGNRPSIAIAMNLMVELAK